MNSLKSFQCTATLKTLDFQRTREQRIFFADLHSILDLALVDLMCKLKNMKTTWQPPSLYYVVKRILKWGMYVNNNSTNKFLTRIPRDTPSKPFVALCVNTIFETVRLEILE